MQVSIATPGGRCFVAMPIREPGTEEYLHFRAVYENIRDMVERAGLTCLRMDDDARSGNINKAIVQQLAESELVIADLTDLNPNVFYEVGVRHVLRRSGTLLMIDKERTPRIPFDLTSYQVLVYEGTVPGIRKMLTALTSSIEQWRDADDLSSSDSPVHDWYAELPRNLLEQTRAVTDESLRLEVVELRRQLEVTRERAQERSAEVAANSESPRQLVKTLRQSLQTTDFVATHLQAAQVSASQQDLNGFLASVEGFFVAVGDKTPRQYLLLAQLASGLGVSALDLALLREAIAQFPSDVQLETHYLLKTSRSHDPRLREEAKQKLAERSGVSLETGELAGSVLKGTDVELGHLLEILHAEKEDELGLRMLDAAIAAGPGQRLAEYYARQLDWVERDEEALLAYQRAMEPASASQNVLDWCGSFFHNAGRHVDALELYVLEAFRDLDDAGPLAKAADEISYILYEPFSLATVQGKAPGAVRAELPDGLGHETIEQLVLGAVSCAEFNMDDRERIRDVQKRAGIDDSLLQQDGGVMTKREKISWLRDLYKLVSSEHTRNSAIAKRLTAARL